MRIKASLLFLLCLLLVAQAGAAPNSGFRLIVHPDNPVTAVDRTFLADAFLKKVTRWRDGEAIRPVDLSSDSSVRGRFSDEILSRSVEAVKSYWQQLIFSGRGLPPPELDSDAEVVRYVLKYPGAVGYVSGSANLDRAKVLTVR